MEVMRRPFACDKCGAMSEQNTNHEGQIYNVKCPNWVCTPGRFTYTTMTFYNGPTEERPASYKDACARPVILKWKAK